MASRMQTVIADVLSEFALITTGNSFNNTVTVEGVLRHPSEVAVVPTIGVEIGTRVIEPKTTDRSTFDIHADVYVQGVCDQGSFASLQASVEALAQDIARVIAAIMGKYLVSANHLWFIEEQNVTVVPYLDLSKGSSKGAVVASFRVTARNIGSDMQ